MTERYTLTWKVQDEPLPRRQRFTDLGAAHARTRGLEKLHGARLVRMTLYGPGFSHGFDTPADRRAGTVNG